MCHLFSSACNFRQNYGVVYYGIAIERFNACKNTISFSILYMHFNKYK